MNQSFNYKKLNVGVVLLIIIVLGGFFIWKGASNQGGASLFRSETLSNTRLQTSTTLDTNQKIIGNVTQFPKDGKSLPCLVGDTTPQIKVISPNGGEVFTAGQQITVKWSTCNIPANADISVAVHYNNNTTGSSYGLPIPVTSLNDGMEVVTLPSTSVLNSSNAQLGKFYEVMLTYDVPNSVVMARDLSDSLFTINEFPKFSLVGTPTLKLEFPIDGVAPEQEDIYLARFRVKVTAGNQDVYIPVDPTGIQHTLLSGGVVTSKVINPTLNYNQVGQGWKVSSNTSEDFIIDLYVKGNNQSERVTLTGIPYGLNSTSLNAYMYNPPASANFKTSIVFLAK